MDRQTLRDWVHRYNAAGIAGLSNRPAPGRSPKLTEGQMAALKAVVLAGPDPVMDGVERWRIVDLCRWVEARQLQRDRDAAAVVVIGAVAPQDPAAPSARRSKPSKRSYGRGTIELQ